MSGTERRLVWCIEGGRIGVRHKRCTNFMGNGKE